ncbi:hypothetical protein [Archaeoglobus sp. JdFR-39]|jgi:hypothetical protein|uniref:hypothetical protein n=1 Tax=Archaeoglobus sp. JdFR-39 TaxID=1934996 RepID=UPI0025BABBB3|nr:hypothetical protein [Archaeoglobus sp. JdFR-39]
MDRLEKIRVANEYLWKVRVVDLTDEERRKLVKEMSKKLKIIGIGRQNPNKVWRLVFKQFNAGICVVCGNLYPMEELEGGIECEEYEGYCPECRDVKFQSDREKGAWLAKLCAKRGLAVTPSVIPLLCEFEVEGIEITEELIDQLCSYVILQGDFIVKDYHVRDFFAEVWQREPHD